MPKIKPEPSRFPSEAEEERVGLSPSPSTYEILEAYNFSKTPRGALKLGKDKRECFVDKIAALSVSPGPVKNASPIKTLNWLS